MNKAKKENQERILKLTELWYEYLNKDHHKAKNCYWYIEQTWSHGNLPYYAVLHYGYVYEMPKKLFGKKYYTYEDAEKALIKLILSAFRKEIKWSKIVLNAEEAEWDAVTRENAEWLLARKGILYELRFVKSR